MKKTQPQPNAIEALAEQFNPSAETISHKATVAELQAAVKRLKKEVGDRAEIIKQVVDSVPPGWRQPMEYKSRDKSSNKSRVGSPCSAVMHLTDWHIGEVTQAAETEGFGGFNFAVAEHRVEKLAKKFLDWIRLHRNSYTVDECVILATSDFISGDIHHELLATNEFPAPVQCVKAGFLMGWLLQSLAPHFKRVRIEFITLDNHGRLTKKCQSAEGGYNNFSFIVAHIAKARVEKIENIEFNIHPCSNKVVNVGGRRYLIAHGHGLQNTWGISYYGIARKVGRESEARMNMPDEKHFDKLVIGHYHHPFWTRGWCIGGSLPGTTAFDHQCGRHCPPCQTGWIVHPKHGDFDFIEFWL